MNRPLMTGLVNLAAFVSSAEGTLDEDALGQALEQLARDLQNLTNAERGEFVSHVQEMAAAAVPGSERRRSLEELVDGLGLG